MNIIKTEIDQLNYSITVVVEKLDYSEKVTAALKTFQKKASIDGFRQGKVPFGLIQKKHGVSFLVEEMNKIISEAISNYLKETTDKVLGEPLPFNEEQKSINWGEQDTYEFIYKVGIAPKFDVKLSKHEKIANYKLKVEKTDIEKQLNNYKKSYGHYDEREIISEKDMLTGSIVQLNDNENILDGGVFAENTSLLMTSFKNDEQKQFFLGKKVGDKVIFNPKISFENEYEIAGLLTIKKDALTENILLSQFEFTIDSIKEWIEADNNQELWDKVYGKDIVKDEKEFTAKIEDSIRNSFLPQSNYKFGIDSKEHLLAKINIDLPEAFLKDWLRTINTQEKLTDETLDKEFSMFLKDLRWQLIKEQIATDNDIKINDDDLLDAAKMLINAQFQQYYGAMQIPEEYLIKYAQEIVEKPEERRNLIETKIEEKVLEIIKTSVKLSENEVTIDEFNGLFK